MKKIRKLAKEFEGQFACFGENAEKYITFSVPIKKELDNGKTMTYELNFVDSFRFMSTTLSKRIDNLKSKLEFKGLKNNKLSYNCNLGKYHDL